MDRLMVVQVEVLVIMLELVVAGNTPSTSPSQGNNGGGLEV
jgi:hypothetical protein